ncbi:hypothetical protein D9Q98_003425 [Chlorella vulgaris]|uniref:Uncharacterized protein n=1 Tax=Chlorella vulgaris TaxID=3077 RepID=A0A9D4TSV6_CHLVU|nr:hypothetical protein D9Q98_003425 [Chlorella vulgaris]
MYTPSAPPTFLQAPQDPNAALPAPAAAQPASSLPPMLAYFPLLSGNLTSSYPDGAYQGAGSNLVAQQDPAFGAVLSCTEALRSYVSIPGLQYGQGGQLAVAMWVKAQPGPGSSMDYAFSHANALTTDLGMDPNVVALYLPERDHPDYGVARAMLRDSTDVRTNGSEPFYLDSDGCISTVRTCNPAGVRNDSLSVTDGQWHMLGVTTRPGGGKGFQLFVDGRMVAEAVEGVEYIGTYRHLSSCRAQLLPYVSGFTKTATGGGPMNLTGNITLCARSDLEATRFFTGSLAHLLIFNTSLSPDNMLELYTTGRGFASALDQASTSQAPAAEEPSTLGGTVTTTSLPPGAAVTEQTAAEAAQPAPQCVTGCTDDGGRPVCYTDTDELILCITSTTAAPGPSAAAAASPLAGPQQAPGTGVQAAAQLAGIATAQACAPGYTCAPLSRQQIAANFGAELGIEAGDIGVCAYTPHEVMLPSSDEVPPAVAFFPLNSQSLQSFPLPDYSGTASGAGVVSDELFGSALLCSREDQDLVALDAVQYARSGAFTVNLWFRPVNMSGDSLSYLFSHRGTSATSSATSNTGWGPNQIQARKQAAWALYLPDEGHPSYGILRTYVKDYNDAPTSQGAISFVDSDGNIAYDGERAAAEAAALYDGGWHMATVSSQPGGIKGYRLYLDGRLVGEVEEGRSYTTPTGFPIPIDGGDPMLLNGNVALCVRSDDPSGRHFDGTLAYLGLYDVALNDTQVELLYSAVAGNMNTAEEAASPPDPSAELPFLPTPSSPGAANITRLSASGQRCQFPVLYNGELVTDCIAISGVFSCQASST